MKKKWFYLVAILALTSCAEDAFEDGSSQDAGIPQEIKLSAGTRGIEVASRGKGSIGDIDGSDANKWSGQKINIWCFKRDLASFTLPQDGTRDEAGIYLKGETATADQEATISTLSFSPSIFYPLTGAYHFVGYYIDDITPDTPEIDTTTGDVLVPITVNGTQDVMIAESALTYEQKVALIEELNDNNKIEYTNLTEVIDAEGNLVANYASKGIVEDEFDKAFSSYTARRQVQPNLVFNHQLAKLNFKIKAGDEKTYAKTDDNGKKLGVYVTGITVKSLTTANIRITKDGKISFADMANESALSVGKKGDNGVIGALTSVGDLKEGTPTPDQVGEGLLVIPATSYTANITVNQEWDSSGQTQIPAGEQSKNYEDISLTIDGGFKAGFSYDIIITVYSNQEINITATLTGWKEGGEIEVSPEDQEWEQNTNGTTGGTN